MRADQLLSRRDLEFLLYEWLDVCALNKRDRFAAHSRQTFDAVLELSADLAVNHFAPHNRAADSHEPRMRLDGTVELIPEIGAALRRAITAGIPAAQFDAELGGLQLPVTVARASLAWLQAANASTSGYLLLSIANANLLARYGSAKQVEQWVRPILDGRYFGTMCLSEPGAGSSLADITTYAQQQDDGTYRVTGTKMWISAGDHDLADNIIHLVLAKIPGAGPGVRGISLFIVPKFLPDGTRNDITMVGLNHKLGNRGTTNTVLAFGAGDHLVDGDAGAVGYLVGRESAGLAYMFHMMNEARIGVGLLAAAIGYTGYRRALAYARVRTQGHLPGQVIGPVPIIQHTDVRRMLLAQKSYVEGGLALCLYCSRLVDEQQTADTAEARQQSALLLDVLTPVAKSWPAQWCLAANDLAIQIHGGYGYARDYDVEQLYRDNRLNAIHEGTHGIQGLDLLGRKVIMNNGAGLRALAAAMMATIGRAEDGDGQTRDTAAALSDAVKRLVEVTGVAWADEDRRVTLANSTMYLEAAGHVIVMWMWLEQLLAAKGKTGPFYDGKRAAATYFLRYELPKTAPQFDLLASLDRTALNMNPAWY